MLLAADAAAPWLAASGLTKVYGGVVALRDTALELRRGEIRGLVGANGAGKSTLVKILTGVTPPTEGAVHVDGEALRLGKPKESLKAGIVAVPQELTVAPTMTVAENVLMGHYPQVGPGFLRRRAMRRAAIEVLEQLSLPMRHDQIVGDLPLIHQRLVMVARAFSFRARLMIFDEPTATISPREVELLLESIGVLSRQGVSILYVSHRLDEVVAICSHVTVLRDGRVVADLGAGQATHGGLVEYLTAGSATERAEVERAPIGAETVLDVASVSGARLHDVSLEVKVGEIVGVAGLTGAGARELLLTICGGLPYSSGSIVLCGEPVRAGSPPRAVSAGIGFLPGDRSLAAFASNSVRFNVSLPTLRRHAKALFVNVRSERSAVASLLDLVALRRDPETRISELSGGNQQKAIVARWLGARPKLLLLDDPTAGVDVATRPEIHLQIRRACADGAGVLLVSTDVDELAELSDRVVVLKFGRVAGELRGAQVTTARVLAAMTGQEPAPRSSSLLSTK